MDTIFALSTAPGKSGVAIIRISGEAASEALKALGAAPCPPPRTAQLKRLLKPGGELIDTALLLWFPTPDSYTGEHILELHTHGSRAVITEIFQILTALPNFRPALPGEFTRRALMNGKMDLTEAEGLADLIEAETALQRRQALHFMSGAAGAFYGELRGRMIRTLAHLEAYIDFPDEDIPQEVTREVSDNVRKLIVEIESLLARDTHGERIREGFSIAIIGAPNVGKSSLLNCLAARDAAIVSPTPGTTRDVIEVYLDIGGFPVTLADTAGLRESTGDEIEKEGMRRSLKRAADADLTLVMVDAQTPQIPTPMESLLGDRALLVVNKCDVTPAPSSFGKHHPVIISAIKNIGIESLIQALTQRLNQIIPATQLSLITRPRHRKSLTEAVQFLRAFQGEKALELQCECLRKAALHIGSITGVIDIETVLDEIFSSFCIGK